MPPAQPLGDDEVEPRALRFLGGEAENPRRRGVPITDVPRRVGIDHRVRAVGNEALGEICGQQIGHGPAPNRSSNPNSTPPVASSGTGCIFGQ
jgi:hypothetical protein